MNVPINMSQSLFSEYSLTIETVTEGTRAL